MLDLKNKWTKATDEVEKQKHIDGLLGIVGIIENIYFNTKKQ